MSAEPVDAEMLAALLDGRLHGAERDAVLARVMEDPTAYAAFLETAELLMELEDAEPAPGIAVTPAAAPEAMRETDGVRSPQIVTPAVTAPGSTSISRRWRVVTPLAIAAGLVLVFFWSRPASERSASPIMAEMLTTLAVATSERVGVDRPTPLAFDVLRGAEATRSPVTTRAVRIGVRAAELTIALGADDPVAASSASSDLVVLSREIEGSGLIVARLDSIRATGSAVVDARGVTGDLRALCGRAHAFDLGQWLVVATRVQATPRAASSEAEVRRTLDRLLASMDRLPAEQRRELRAVEAYLLAWRAATPVRQAALLDSALVSALSP